MSSITFDGDVEMLRCRLCGMTSWTLAGRTVAHEVAHAALKGTFISTRRQAPVVRARREPRVLDLRDLTSPAPTAAQQVPAPEPVVELPQQGVDEALSALMRAKGLSGSWTVSG